MSTGTVSGLVAPVGYRRVSDAQLAVSISITAAAIADPADGTKTGMPARATHVNIQCEGGTVRYRIDGVAPVAGVVGTGSGRLLQDGASVLIAVADLSQVRVVKNSGTTVVLHLTYLSDSSH